MGGEHAPAVHGGAQSVAVVVGGHVEAAGQAGHDARLGLLVPAVVLELLPGGPEQEGAEDVELPRQVLDGDGADRDEHRAGDQRDDDAHHQHLLLVAAGHLELGHDDEEHEQVVHAEAVLGDPAGEELGAVLRIAQGEEQPREDQRQRHVEPDPQAGLLHGGLVGAAPV